MAFEMRAMYDNLGLLVDTDADCCFLAVFWLLDEVIALDGGGESISSPPLAVVTESCVESTLPTDSGLLLSASSSPTGHISLASVDHMLNSETK
jgi:hypothetical protein